MPNFEKREEAFEKKFALEEEHKFLADAHVTRQLALWAAGKLEKTGDDAAAYAAAVVAAEVDGGGHDAVIRKLAVDLAGAGVNDLQIRRKLEELAAKAAAEAKR
ncbi:MAG: ATPase inhibitor subunit zeta [Xanthobacteraceae bacterium]|nr:ATPase inhibitor subunit zeta [Xanthobacteraceae bacterium]